MLADFAPDQTKIKRMLENYTLTLNDFLNSQITETVMT